ncbi:MAG: hypothetical protein EOP43_06515 [Sphingobacteriaceae bacterium]|nr:MAG: hypothetical protein EOP43_06515 [Sphingobacteriaceae bacterium]
MKLKLLLFTILLLSIYQTKAQVKFGAKSGVGIFFDFLITIYLPRKLTMHLKPVYTVTLYLEVKTRFTWA